MRSAFFLIFTVLLLCSCNEYQKVLKNEDVKAKYELAERYYNEGDYKRAKRLFEQIAPKYVGKPQGERVMFFFANSFFKTGDHYTSGFQFERFIKSYPKSDKIQEATFLEAKSYFKLSPKYSLDQTDTDKALGKLQNFINTYPDSEFFAEANDMAQQLTRKKEKKQVEIGKQFDKLGEFNFPILVSATKSLDNFVSENPGSPYREEALFHKFKAAANLALNSTINKMSDRIDDAVSAYGDLMKSFPETVFKKDADNLYNTLQKQQKRLSK